MTLASCLYAGSVMHRRLAPTLHRFRYRVWWLMVDLEELPQLCARSRLLSLNRFNLFSFYARDFGTEYFGAGHGELRRDVVNRLARANVSGNIGRIYLLTMPRLLGYAFNPLSVYFCLRADGDLCAIIYEVHNTFGERHSYVLPARVDGDGLVRQSADKAFYVSPFIEMELRYKFRVRASGDDLAVAITASRQDAAVIYASLHGKRRELSDGQLLRAFLAYPLVTLKVVAAIHWQALRLWLKGLPLVPRHSTPRPASSQQGNLHA